MPYRTVHFAAGQYYHLYNRGVAGQPIFRDDGNYLFVLRLVKTYAAALHLAVIAYCLMPNHYHLLLRQDGEASAGLLPQRVFNSYSKAFNKLRGRTGVLFEGRYQAVRVAEEGYVVHLCRYIHANPTKDRLVPLPEEWPYSNYLEWIDMRSGTLVDRSFLRGYFPVVESYRQFEMDYLAGLARLPAGIEGYLLD